MRTTVTLEPDVQVLIERLMRQRGLSFKAAINEAIRRGLAPKRSTESATIPRNLGEPKVDLTKALALAGSLEDEALATKLVEGK
ncbi:MAG: CopG family transcriptional regulator [Acidimicrobiia bacterium]